MHLCDVTFVWIVFAAALENAAVRCYDGMATAGWHTLACAGKTSILPSAAAELPIPLLRHHCGMWYPQQRIHCRAMLLLGKRPTASFVAIVTISATFMEAQGLAHRHRLKGGHFFYLNQATMHQCHRSTTSLSGGKRQYDDVARMLARAIACQTEPLHDLLGRTAERQTS